MEHMKALLHHHSSSAPSDTEQTMSAEQIEQEKRFVAHFSDQQHSLPPSEMCEFPSFARFISAGIFSAVSGAYSNEGLCRQHHPRNRELGGSSRGLGVGDFDLVRTLGTGAWCD